MENGENLFFKLPGFIDFIISKHVLLMVKAMGLSIRIFCYSYNEQLAAGAGQNIISQFVLKELSDRVYIHTIR